MIADVLRFLEDEQRTSLSKYRGKPWTVDPREQERLPPGLKADPMRQFEGWDIMDKVTGRLSASVYRSNATRVLELQPDLVPEKYHATLRERTDQSLDDCAAAVWNVSIEWYDRLLWWTSTWRCESLTSLPSSPSS